MPGYFTPSLRRRLSPLVLVVGLLLFGKLTHEELPQEQVVRFLLTPEQQQTARALRVTYAAEGDVLSGLEQRFPGRAPAEVVHTPSLKPGRYALAIDLIGADGAVTRVDRALSVPTEAIPRISLGETR
jgi:hypothetical protein